MGGHEVVAARHVVTGPGAPILGPTRLGVADGLIAGLEPSVVADAGGRLLIMPCLVNAHDHARPVRSSSFGAAGKPLEVWLHYLALLPALDPYAATAASLARSALGGCGAVMIHHTRVQGLTDLPTEAAAMARAARDVGVRAGFAVAMRDRNPVVYGSSDPVLRQLEPGARALVEARLVRQPASVADQMRLVDEVADAVDAPDFVVQYGPNGVQWCSTNLLAAVAEASGRTGRRIHMHCLETRYQRDWADRTFPQGMLRHLDELGFLSSRLTLAHCTHARPDELELLADRGVTIAVNTSSNLGIRSGIAPVAAMVARGCRVALGLDGLALDEDDDALREMRLAHLLHGGTGFELTASREAVLAMAVETGHRAVLGRDGGGRIEPGAPADFLVLDWDRVDDDRFRPDLDPGDLLFARVAADHIRELRVGGRRVVADGRVLGIDLPALSEAVRDRIRHAIGADGAFAAVLPELEAAIRADLEPRHGCC